MTGIEILFIVLTIASFLWGFKKGIIVQMGSMVGFFVAIAACRILGGVVSDAVFTATDGGDPSQASMNHLIASCIGHILVFIVAWIGVWLLARTLKFFVKAVHIGFMDRLLGALFMALKTGMVISLMLNFIKVVAPASGIATSQSTVMTGFSRLAPFILGFVQQSAS